MIQAQPISLTKDQLKRKLTFDEMILHLKEKNIQFNLISPDKAKYMLEYSNYLYKISAYRKNFEQNKHGHYINLEFGILYDLATIDMRLRYLVLQMSLDIEHSIKTKLLSDITNNPNEDGYSIVMDFLNYTNESIEDYMHPMKSQTHYNYGIYAKHHENTPVWVLFEILTFGKFVKFVEFYCKTRDRRKYKDLEKVLKYVKNIRNLAAHNSPILIDITNIKQVKSPTATITKFVRKVDTITNESSRKRLSNRKTHDLTALLYVFDKYVSSSGIKNNRYKELQVLLDRCKRYKDYYATNEALVAVFKYFNKIIDFLIKDL